MDERIAVLERDVEVIKAELTELRRDCIRAEAVGKDIAQLRNDVAQLNNAVERLENNDAKFAEELVSIRVGMTRLATEQSRFATREDIAEVRKEMAAMKGELRSDIRSVESNLKGWMLGIALTLFTMTSGMFYTLYGTLKAMPGYATPAAQQLSAPPPDHGPATQR